MGCPGSVIINSNLHFNIAIRNGETGQLSDANSDPIYRIYDDETNTLLISGTMTKLGTLPVVGFYAGVQLCGDTYFTDGKSYILCIEATVGQITGGISFGFNAYDEISTLIGVPIMIQGFDAISGKQVQIKGRYA